MSTARFVIMQVDWASGVPAHEQIAAELRRRLDDGVYPERSRLPHRDVLAAEFDVSHFTVTKATRLLADDGRVVYAPGRGLLVVTKPAEPPSLSPEL